jgi:hypothetical protein
MQRINSSKPARTIRGGIVTTIIIFGLLLLRLVLQLLLFIFDVKIKDEDNLHIHLNQLVMIGNHQVRVIVYLIIQLIIVVIMEIILIMLLLMLMNICLLQQIWQFGDVNIVCFFGFCSVKILPFFLIYKNIIDEIFSILIPSKTIFIDKYHTRQKCSNFSLTKYSIAIKTTNRNSFHILKWWFKGYINIEFG